MRPPMDGGAAASMTLEEERLLARVHQLEADMKCRNELLWRIGKLTARIGELEAEIARLKGSQ